MSYETSYEELAKGRAYKLSIGGYEIVSQKLEGFKAAQIAAILSPIDSIDRDLCQRNSKYTKAEVKRV